MKKKRIWIWHILLVLLLVGAVAVGLIFHVLPRYNAQRSMPSDGFLILMQQPDGSLDLSWPPVYDVDFYRITVSEPDRSSADNEHNPKILWNQDILGVAKCNLASIPQDRELTISVTCGVYFDSFGKRTARLGDNPISVTTIFAPPAVKNPVWKASPDQKTVQVDFEVTHGNCCRLWLEGEEGVRSRIRETSENNLCLTFGPQGDLDVPEFGQTVKFTFDACRREPGLLFYGTASAEMTLSRNDFLGRNLNLQFTDLGHNVCSMSWDETKGDCYEIQLQDPETGTWKSIAEIPGNEERRYVSPHLPKYRTFTYRVVAVGNDPMEDSDYAAVSQEFSLITWETPVFCTVWPCKDLPVYADLEKSSQIGTAEGSKALCVLEEKAGMFGVRLNGQTGYIDSRYCLINLPEYIGRLCRYKITNSHDCRYMVHEFGIPDMTGKMLDGYENIHLSDETDLVPLLYPTAKKLAVAAKEAISQGYQLKIYDAFRPYNTTKQIFRQTEEILDLPIPDKPYTDVDIADLNLPDPPENGSEDLGKHGLTYKMVMVSELYGLDFFLAAGGSAHNQGIAMDLTMVDLNSGEDVPMQSAIHDLSRYSVVTENTADSDLLASFMTNAGFGTLVSEWWHFQDNDSRAELSPPYVQEGLSGACWMADDSGWRYRTEDGSYYTDCAATIDGTEYMFNNLGYLCENPR